MSPFAFRTAGLVCAAIAWSAAAAQQARVELQFGSEGVRRMWLGPATLSGPAEDPVEAQGATFEMPLARAKPTDKLYVWDVATGNLAVKEVSALTRAWRLQPADYNMAAKVLVRAEHRGLPLSAAIIEVTSGNRREVALLTPKDEGVATLWAIPHGPVGVVVEYAPLNGTTTANKKSPKQTFELAAKRDAPDPTFVVSIADAVETIGSEANQPAEGTATPATATAPRKEDSGNDFGGILRNVMATLLTLGVAGGIGYAILQYVRRNPDQVKDQLAKVGVTIPDPSANPEDDPTVPPPSFRITEPMAPIVLGAADPIPVAPAAAAPGAPRLIRSDGLVFPLQEGVSTIGRDFASTIAWADESSVSRRHAEIEGQGGAWVLRDSGSTNGTFLNGAQVTSEAILRPGDSLKFGQVDARFEA